MAYISPEKNEKTVYFSSLQICTMSKTIFPNGQITFSGITIIFHSKIEAWERRHSCNSHVSLRHVTKKPKETCQSTCKGPQKALTPLWRVVTKNHRQCFEDDHGCP